MSEFDNGQSPFESEEERASRERKEKVAGFRLNIDPEAMDAPVSFAPKRKAPPLRKTEEEPAIRTVPSAFRRMPTAIGEEDEEKPVQKSADAVNAIAAAVAAKMDEEGDIGEWNGAVEPVEPENTAVTESGDVPDMFEEQETDEQVAEPLFADEPLDSEAPVRILDEEDEEPVDPNAPVRILDEEEYPEEPEGKRTSCMGLIFYFVCVLAVSCVLAFIGVTGALDMLGMNKSDAKIDVTIPSGADAKEVAEILHDNKLVSHPLIFRLFSKVTHSDGNYRSGVFTIAANSGYQGIISQLQSVGERETVDVTIPEGYNVKDIAELLEANEVCSAEDFLSELESGDFSEYKFVSSVPKVGAGTDYPYRIYRFEGYLFPDTYTFYKECSAHAVIDKFFDNFETRVDTKLQASLKAKDMTLDEALTLASILQREADNSVDMAKMACVFHNRLNDPANFLHLESDVTTEYVENFKPGADENNPNFRAYSTYICEGLPTGPICNPGLVALKAVAYPSEDADIVNCYYFATDTSEDPTITYYSETLGEHEAICREYGIGMYGD